MAEKEEILQGLYDKGYYYEIEYQGCAQCTIAAVQDFFDIDDLVLKTAAALSGGIAGTIEGPCGGFLAGSMILGYFFGRTSKDLENIEALWQAEKYTLQLKNKFIQKYGSYTCRHIQEKIMGRSYLIMDPEQRSLFEEAGGHDDKCPSVVGQAAAMIGEILLDNGIPAR